VEICEKEHISFVDSILADIFSVSDRARSYNFAGVTPAWIRRKLRRQHRVLGFPTGMWVLSVDREAIGLKVIEPRNYVHWEGRRSAETGRLYYDLREKGE